MQLAGGRQSVVDTPGRITHPRVAGTIIIILAQSSLPHIALRLTAVEITCTFYCSCGGMASAVEGTAVDQGAGGLGGEGIAEKLEQHGEAFAGFLGDVQANVLGQLKAQSVGPEGFVENFQGGCLIV